MDQQILDTMSTLVNGSSTDEFEIGRKSKESGPPIVAVDLRSLMKSSYECGMFDRYRRLTSS
jgi:hypothetical protein